MILRPGTRPQPTEAHPDGRPLWRFQTWDYRDREPRDAITDDPAIVEWLGGLRHSDAFQADVQRVPGRPDVPLVTRFRPFVNRARSVSPAPDLSGLMAGTPEGALMDWAGALRGYLEAEAWPDFRRTVTREASPPPGACPSTGMCGVTTALAQRVLGEADPDGGWQPDGGHPTVLYARQSSQFRRAFAELDGGMWDCVRERWDGHYWLAGTNAGEAVILDLTADQYGWTPIVLADANDPRFRASYRPAQVRKDLSYPGKAGDWVRRHAARFADLCERDGVPSPIALDGPRP